MIQDWWEALARGRRLSADAAAFLEARAGLAPGELSSRLRGVPVTNVALALALQERGMRETRRTARMRLGPPLPRHSAHPPYRLPD